MNYVVVVRGRLKARKAEAQKVHDATVGKVSPQSRQMGSTGHRAYLHMADEKSFLAIDTWDNIEAIQKLYSDPALAEEFGKLFDGQPEVTIWADTGWMSY
jgi:quinol monooxygenase YgiN